MKSPAERSMGTATATTVSTVVSDYTMESGGGMRKSKRIMPRNSEEDAAKGNEPVTWYAFFSEKAGREYYYEPKSKTVTWVMPDDHHPYPNPNHRRNSMNETADQPRLMSAPKVKRKVSWGTAKSEDRLLQSSDEKGQFLPDESISDTTVEKSLGNRLLIGAACIVVLGGAFCLGRLWDSSVDVDIGATDVVDMPQPLAVEKPHVGETFTESVAVTLKEGQKLQGESLDGAEEEVQEESSPSPAPAKCKIPFAYIVSAECRRRSVPLFDAEAFSLLMMQ